MAVRRWSISALCWLPLAVTRQALAGRWEECGFALEGLLHGLAGVGFSGYSGTEEVRVGVCYQLYQALLA